MSKNFNEIIFNCITSVNALMTSNEVAEDDKAVIKLNRFKKWLNEFASANDMKECGDSDYDSDYDNAAE